ncbi:MAG TPA: class II fructose-bisphosphate aldolase [Candidatus Saccharimonadales bacterium]|nr:class II fructose-bisphosphate aldolase [Candidatus Saccharimonadales bacterium]
MMNTNAKALIMHARKNGYAIGAFNAANTETIKAITQAAKKLNSPVILEASDGEVNYIGMAQLVAIKKIYQEELNIPIILNLDHGKDFDACKSAIEAGFDYIHFDGSKFAFEENIKICTEVVKLAHAKGLPVEGEFTHIAGSSADHTKEDATQFNKAEYYTNPEQAKEFVAKTGVDVLASFIGNSHGIYATEKRLDLNVFKKITEALPNTLFSLHGGSGIHDDDVRAAIKMGIVKVNINSEMRIAFKMTLQQSINASNEIAIYKITPDAIKAVQDVVERKIKLFGSANEA